MVMQSGKVEITLTARLVNLETGEVLGASEASAELPSANDVDISTRTGILDGIDRFENAMLGARDALMHAATEHYNEYLEENKAEDEPQRIAIQTRLGLGQTVAAHSYAKKLKPRERMRSTVLEEAILHATTKGSYRYPGQFMKDIVPGFGETGAPLKASTLCEHVEKEGTLLDAAVSERTSAVLKEHFREMQGDLPTLEELKAEFSRAQQSKEIADVLCSWRQSYKQILLEQIERYNCDKEPPLQISPAAITNDILKEPGGYVYISVDEVQVSHQKEERGEGSVKDGKYVHHAVIHVHAPGNHAYDIAAQTVREANRRLLAALIDNGLLKDCSFVFLTDGAQNLRKELEAAFGFLPYTHILDWYHLRKKTRELLSMAIRGRKAKKESIKQDIVQLLWVGNWKGAIAYLKALSSQRIANKAKFDELLGYLERKSPYIPCYALRKLANLPNSSNPVETENKIAVADRQKNNGTSWSRPGSYALAQITVLAQNGALHDWVSKRKVHFSFRNAS